MTGELLHTYDDEVWNTREITVGNDGAFAIGRFDGTFVLARNFGSDLLRFHALSSSSSRFQLRAQGPVGHSLLVETSSDFASWSAFTNVTLTTTEMDIIDLPTPPGSHCFFRGSFHD
ncbi:MAG: hypothetical protein ACXW32_11125 [Limisphaerales bacterium]